MRCLILLVCRIDDTRFPGCVGWPLPQVECKLDDENGILIKGGTVFKEYYRNPEATAKEFTSDGWFKTGDNAFSATTWTCRPGRNFCALYAATRVAHAPPYS